MTTHTLPSRNLDTLTERVGRLNKTAAKLHLTPITVTEFSREVKPLDPSKPADVFIEWVTLDIIGESPIVNGWSFVAQIEHGEAGNILRNLGAQPLPEIYRTAAANCDHCHTTRPRNHTYILVNTAGEYRQVGSSCLKDFTGHADPHTIAAWLEDLDALTKDLDDCGEFSDYDMFGSHSHLLDSHVLVANVAAMIRTYGWTGKAKAAEQQTASTCDRAFNNMLDARNRSTDYIKPTDDDRQLADTAIEWARSLEGASEYEWNLKIAALPNYCNVRNAGLLASVIAAYRRATGQTETGQQTPSEFIGSVGDKLTIEVTVTRIIETSGAYGLTSVVSMKAGDNLLTWFASGQVALEQGHDYKIKGTIKSHSIYNGHNVTYLTHCKAL